MRCTQIGHVLQSLNIRRVDVWSLDVEGAELSVLQGMDWSIQVGVLLIESVDDAVRTFLRARGYRFHRKTHMNEIWVGNATHER